MPTSNPEFDATLRRVEAQAAKSRRRTLGFTVLLIVLGLGFLGFIGRSIVSARRDLTTRSDQLTKANTQLAKYDQPTEKTRMELDQLQVSRTASYQELNAALTEAADLQNQLAQSDAVYAGDLAATAKSLQTFNTGLDGKITDLNKRIEELKRPPETRPTGGIRERAGGEPQVAVTPAANPAASTTEADGRTMLLDAVTVQRRMYTDTLGKAQQYQSGTAALHAKLNAALERSKKAQAELNATDEKIAELSKVAVAKKSTQP